MEMREHPAIAGNPASREIRNPPAAEATVEEAAMPTAAGVAAAVMPIAVAEVAAAEIEAVGKKANEND